MTERTSPRRRQSSLPGIFMRAGGILFVIVAQFNVLSTVPAQSATEEYETVSGRLDQVNVVEKKGTITTDVGKQVAFQIAKPELFMNLSPGQRITIKLDKQGRAVRVMDNAAPELPPPPSGPR